MLNLDEEIIFNKLTGKLPIYHLSTDADSPRTPVEQDELTAAIQTMKETKYNPAYKELPFNRNLSGRVILFFKRAIRKCLKWYLEPVCFQQSNYNGAVSFLIEQLLENQKVQKAEIEKLKKQLELQEHLNK